MNIVYMDKEEYGVKGKLSPYLVRARIRKSASFILQGNAQIELLKTH